MNRLAVGIIIGIVLGTVGVKGVANMLNKTAPTIDGQVDKVKEFAKEGSK